MAHHIIICLPYHVVRLPISQVGVQPIEDLLDIFKVLEDDCQQKYRVEHAETWWRKTELQLRRRHVAIRYVH